jgi:[protein-PII] uridylyltransferase
MPRQLKHFRFAPRIEFIESTHADRTLLNLVAPDRPGLLADVAHVLRDQQLRVQDARIATFGERAEDQFQLTDRHDQPLTESSRQALREALLASLEPEKTPGDPH